MTPLLVAYRDGFTDQNNQPVAWKMVTGSDLKSVDFMVEGPYSVAVVCMVDGAVLTWQAFHTLDDDTSDTVKESTLQTPCNAAPAARNTITGTLDAKGVVHLGDADGTTAAASPFTFSLQVTNGTYDLVATTANADPATNTTLIQHGVMVTGNADLGTINVSTSTAQVALGIALGSPPNPDKSTETVKAKVDVTTKNNPAPATVSSADYNLKDKTIKIYALPNAALSAGDTQTATFIGTNHPKDADDKPINTITFTRAITRPFSIGDDVSTGMTTFTLPGAITIPDWGFDKNRLSVALPALPALDDLTIKTFQVADNGAIPVRYEINITASYFQQTALARPVFDTDIPNFQPAWKIDFTKHYIRQITSQRDVFSKGKFVDHEESEFSEDVNAP